MKNKIKVESSFKDIKNFINIPSYRKGVIDEAPEEPVNANFAVNSKELHIHSGWFHVKLWLVSIAELVES